MICQSFNCIVSVKKTTSELTIGTEPHVTLQIGTRGLLPCDVKGAIEYVHWIKGPNIDFTNEPVIIYFPNQNDSNKEGPGYDNGKYDITVEFSLVLKTVDIYNEDVYFCTVHDMNTNELYYNQTIVTVFGKYEMHILVTIIIQVIG